MSVIVSLSSIPPRFGDLETTLNTILAQTAQIDEIRLYIPKRYRRFPDYDGSLPVVPKGVRIVRPEEDLGPATKVLFAAEELRGTDARIIFCDDDRLYEPERFRRILRVHRKRPDDCIAPAAFDLPVLFGNVENAPRPRAVVYSRGWGYRLKRTHRLWRKAVTGKKQPGIPNPLHGRSGYTAFLQGYGGVLVRPDFFDDVVYDIPPVLWAVDDIWLSGHLERRGIRIWSPSYFYSPTLTKNHGNAPLYLADIDQTGREDADLACFRYMQKTYGIWQ